MTFILEVIFRKRPEHVAPGAQKWFGVRNENSRVPGKMPPESVIARTWDSATLASIHVKRIRLKPHIPHTFNLQKISRLSATMNTGPRHKARRRPNPCDRLAPSPPPPHRPSPPPPTQKHEMSLRIRNFARKLPRHQRLSDRGSVNLQPLYACTPLRSLLKSAI